MIKIDTTTWQEFDIVFNNKTKKGLFKVDVGGDVKNIKNDMLPSENPDDKVYVVSNTAKNNGIVEEIEGYKTKHKNVITLATRGNDYKAFYHENYYILPVVRTICLTPVAFKLNQFTAFFLSSIFHEGAYKYGYGRFLSGERIKKDKIKLPVDNRGSPNWQFMENYIKSILHKVDFSNVTDYSKNYKKSNHKVATTNWQEFSLIKNTENKVINNDGVFTILHHEKLNVNNTNEGIFPLVARGSVNNNIHSFIDYDADINLENTLTINLNGAIGKVYYHDYNYVTTQNVHVLAHNNLNKYSALFLKSLMEFNFENKYSSHGRELIQEKLVLEKIKLPTDKQGNPDWQFMENYIKSLPYSSNL